VAWARLERLAPFIQRRPDRKGVDDARIAQDQDKDRATPELGETDVLALPPRRFARRT
jgi:hypothetical protein